MIYQKKISNFLLAVVLISFSNYLFSQSTPLATDRARVTIQSISDYYAPTGPKLKVLRTDTNTPLRAGAAWIWEKQRQEEPETYYALMNSKGLNAVRMILFDTWEVETYLPSAQFTPTDWENVAYRNRQLARMERAVNYASKYGMYIIINSHNHIPKYDEVYVNALWKYVAPYFANRTHVLYELANEPMNGIGRNGDMDMGAATATASPRLQALKRTYDIARAGAPNTMLMILTPPGINDYAFGTGMGNLADSFTQLPGTTVDWTKTAVAYHLYNNDAAYGAATNANNLRNLHQRYAGWPSENSFPASVTITDGDQWRSPSFDNDLYVNQTCEKLGIGWAMWFIDGVSKFNANFPIMWADAVAKGWNWNKDINSTLKMPILFSDNMVLQRDKPIKIWGEVLPNLPVTITFDGQTYNTTCGSNGKFSTFLPAKNASANSYILTVTSNLETFSYSNVVMGDVFLCGGESNMSLKVNGTKTDQLANATADSNYPNLRFFEVAKIVSGGLVLNASHNLWKSATPERIVNWSAVAFFVGRDLHKDINVPVGLIDVSHEGSPSDAFISPEAYANDPILNAAKRADANGILSYYTTPSSLYISMISKVVGYPTKAVLWYQAEANSSYWPVYKTIFKGLIKDWRAKFNDPTLPWLFVQLPRFTADGSTNTSWAETRDIQLQISKEDSATRMAVTIDLGDENDIHPKDKYTVAKRMLPQVKALVYGQQIVNKSPTYKWHEIQGADLILAFDNVGSGLTATKAMTEFEIAGADKVYKTATATILPNNKIKLTNATISNPYYARYAFINSPTVSVYTTDNLSLPMSPFKTELEGCKCN